jgi:hypothetical protein
MAQTQSQARSQQSHPRGAAPKVGEKFHCEKCGMEMTVTKDCPCPDASHMTFQCCDRPLARA